MTDGQLQSELQDCLQQIDTLVKLLPEKVTTDLYFGQIQDQSTVQDAKDVLARIEAEIAEDVYADKAYSNESARKAACEKRQRDDEAWVSARAELRRATINDNAAKIRISQAETEVKTSLARLSAVGKRAELISNYLYLKARLAELEAMRLRAQLAAKH